MIDCDDGRNSGAPSGEGAYCIKLKEICQVWLQRRFYPGRREMASSPSSSSQTASTSDFHTKTKKSGMFPKDNATKSGRTSSQSGQHLVEWLGMKEGWRRGGGRTDGGRKEMTVWEGIRERRGKWGKRKKKQNSEEKKEKSEKIKEREKKRNEEELNKGFSFRPSSVSLWCFPQHELWFWFPLLCTSVQQGAPERRLVIVIRNTVEQDDAASGHRDRINQNIIDLWSEINSRIDQLILVLRLDWRVESFSRRRRRSFRDLILKETWKRKFKSQASAGR